MDKGTEADAVPLVNVMVEKDLTRRSSAAAPTAATAATSTTTTTMTITTTSGSTTENRCSAPTLSMAKHQCTWQDLAAAQRVRDVAQEYDKAEQLKQEVEKAKKDLKEAETKLKEAETKLEEAEQEIEKHKHTKDADASSVLVIMACDCCHTASAL